MGALRGAGDTKILMLIAISFAWGIMVPGVLLIIFCYRRFSNRRMDLSLNLHCTGIHDDVLAFSFKPLAKNRNGQNAMKPAAKFQSAEAIQLFKLQGLSFKY